jgi:hypothetical protein
MKIPNKFKIAGFEINVKFVEVTDDNSYGYWSDSENAIYLAKKISVSPGTLVVLTNRQIENTFLHELVHVLQFYSGKSYDEIEASTFANFLLEFVETKTYLSNEINNK